MQTDTITWHAELHIFKYGAEDTARLLAQLGFQPGRPHFDAAGIEPYEVGYVEHNLLTTPGLTRITSLITAAGGQGLTNTSGRIGVGNGAGTAAVGDTDLSAAAGSANRQFQVFDATYPTTSGGVITAQATFGGSLANFAWAEWGIDIGTPTVTAGTTVNATLLNHKTGIAQGAKTSGQTWVAQATVTLS